MPLSYLCTTNNGGKRPSVDRKPVSLPPVVRRAPRVRPRVFRKDKKNGLQIIKKMQLKKKKLKWK